MSRESRIWLAAAGVVTIAVVVVIVTFGLRSVPSFPSLYSAEAPRIEGTAAYVQHGRDSCLNLLDVGTGVVDPVICEEWMWIEGWDENGHLIVQRGGAWEGRSVVVPETGAITDIGGQHMEPVREVEGLRSRSREGRVTLTASSPAGDVTLIEVDGPRDYGFWSYGRSGDWVWAVDSEERLLVVAADGSSGPWLVIEDVQEVAWR